MTDQPQSDRDRLVEALRQLGEVACRGTGALEEFAAAMRGQQTDEDRRG